MGEQRTPCRVVVRQYRGRAGEYPIVVADGDRYGYNVADCNDYHASPEEQQANARYIAAAWNACEALSTEALEGGVVGKLLAYTECQEAWDEYIVWPSAEALETLNAALSKAGLGPHPHIAKHTDAALKNLRTAALAAARGTEPQE